jgi:hypothetical protein
MNIISISFAISASSSSSAISPSQSSNSTNCIVSDWSDCVNSKRTKTITQATNGGIACTPSQNALPLTEFCDYVTVYPEPNYQGTGVIYYPPNSYNISELNNIISSIKIPPGLRATLYDDEKYDGATLVLTSDEPDLNNRGFDNVVSSIIIQSDNNCKVDYSPCVNGLTTKKITPATKDGIACTSNQNELPLTKSCNDCKVDYPVCKYWLSEKIITQASNGGIPCTPAQNALPLTKECNNCLVHYSECINGVRNKTITPASNGGIACTPSQNALPLTKICNDHCKLFSLCNFKNGKLNKLIDKYPDLDISDNTEWGGIAIVLADDIKTYPDVIINSIKSEGYDMILYSLPNYKGTKMELIGKISIECLGKPMRSAIIAPSPNGGFACTQLTKVCKDNGGLFSWYLDKQKRTNQIEYSNKYPNLNISNNTYIGSSEYTSVDDTQTYPDMIIHSIKSEGYDIILYSLPNYTGAKMELTGKIIIEYLDPPMRSAIINTMYKKSII